MRSDPRPRRRARKQPLNPLEEIFSKLLASLEIKIPENALLPVAQNQRLAVDILESFLTTSAKQLADLLRGEHEGAKLPLHQLEVIVSLFYRTINDVYIGVDSHLPSRFSRVHPFLLENLASSDDATPTGRFGTLHHAECHGARWMRIVPFTRDMLQEDVQKYPDVVWDYFEEHQKNGITLLAVEPKKRDGAREAILKGEWTGDVGLWVNTCALLFDPSIDPGNKELRLELVYPTDVRFARYLRYVRRLILDASVVFLHGDRNPQVELSPLTDDDKEHLLWDLETMFEAGLADVWDEFVAPEKRLRSLGPFIEEQLAEMGLDRARILDAATGVGSESIYLLQRGHEVTSNEIEPRLIAHARDAAAAADVPLKLTRFDWRHFEHLADAEAYDMILVLGNSLSCLTTEADVRMVLTRFAYLLRPNGRLIVDERNYALMFAKRRMMSQPDFRFPGNVVYCSDTIQARPSIIPDAPGIDNHLLTLEYHRTEDGKAVGRFKVLPFAEGQLERLLLNAGFSSVRHYSNLHEENGSPGNGEFVTYVASRSFVESGVGASTPLETVIAFTDISGSTFAKKALGEERYAAAWKSHNSKVRSLVGKHGGRIVNSTGDGYLISFDGAAPAVVCMRDVVRSPGTDDLVVRAGISTGRVVEDEYGNLRGHEVDVASRICDTARPNLVVVDDRVKLAAPDFDWISLGQVELKGAGSRKLWRSLD